MDNNDDLPFSTQCDDERMLAPLQSTPLERIADAVSIGRITVDDVVFDLGCGDGQVVSKVNELTGATCVGYELDDELIATCEERFRDNEMVTIRSSDFMDASFEEATIIFIFLQMWSIYLLEDKLLAFIGKGKRVVSYMWHFESFDKRKDVSVATNEGKTIFVYTRVD